MGIRNVVAINRSDGYRGKTELGHGLYKNEANESMLPVVRRIHLNKTTEGRRLSSWNRQSREKTDNPDPTNEIQDLAGPPL